MGPFKCQAFLEDAHPCQGPRAQALPPASHFLPPSELLQQQQQLLSQHLPTRGPQVPPSPRQAGTQQPQSWHCPCPPSSQAPPAPPSSSLLHLGGAVKSPCSVRAPLQVSLELGFVSKAMPTPCELRVNLGASGTVFCPLWFCKSVQTPVTTVGSISLWAEAGSTWIYFLVGFMIF